MKTKFSKIIEIKKRRIDEFLKELSETRKEIVIIKAKISQLLRKSLDNNMPDSGEIILFKQHQVFVIAFKQELNNLENKKKNLKSKESDILNKIKEANIELEKFKHLHSAILKELEEKEKEKEQKVLDEMGTISFMNTRGNI